MVVLLGVWGIKDHVGMKTKGIQKTCIAALLPPPIGLHYSSPSWTPFHPHNSQFICPTVTFMYCFPARKDKFPVFVPSTETSKLSSSWAGSSLPVHHQTRNRNFLTQLHWTTVTRKGGLGGQENYQTSGFIWIQDLLIKKITKNCIISYRTCIFCTGFSTERKYTIFFKFYFYFYFILFYFEENSGAKVYHTGPKIVWERNWLQLE